VVLQARGHSGWLPPQILAGLVQSGDRLAGVRRAIWMALGGMDLVDTEIKRRLDQLQAQGALSPDESQRVAALLLSERASSLLCDAPELPSHSDVLQLHAQLDALSAAIEQLLAERRQG
jgi:polyhydroxyalkanoate synthesis regulator phasin